MCVSLFLDSVPCNWSMCLFLCQYHIFLITVTSLINNCSRKLPYFIVLWILAILGMFIFCIKSLVKFCKLIKILIRIMLNLEPSFGNWHFYDVEFYYSRAYSIWLHLFRTSLMFLNKVLLFSIERIYMSFVRFILRNFK